MDEKTRSRVYKVLQKVTGKELTKLNLKSDLKSQLTLDSIQIVELFAALEKELGVELPLSLMTVKSGEAFFNILEEQIYKK